MPRMAELLRTGECGGAVAVHARRAPPFRPPGSPTHCWCTAHQPWPRLAPVTTSPAPAAAVAHLDRAEHPERGPAVGAGRGDPVLRRDHLHPVAHAEGDAAGQTAADQTDLQAGRLLRGHRRAWTRPSQSSRRSSSSCAIRSRFRSWARRCRRASSCTGPRAPARRCWRRPWRTNPERSSSRSRQPRSSRCSPAWERLASGGCSTSPASTNRRSSSSTSSTPSAGGAAWTSRARRTRRSTSCSSRWTASPRPGAWW